MDIKQPKIHPLSEQENEYFTKLIMEKNIKALEEFINSREVINASQSTLDTSGQSFLHISVIGGDYSTLKLLLQKCKFNTGCQDADGNTAYHYAANSNKNNELKLLLRYDYTSSSIADKNGRTPHDITKFHKNPIGYELLSNPVPSLKTLCEITVINNLHGDAHVLDLPKTIINEIQSVPQERNIEQYSIEILGNI